MHSWEVLLCIPQRLLQLFPCSQQRIIIPFHLLLSALSLSLLPFHQEMESELRLMLPRRPTTLNSGRSGQGGWRPSLLPSLPNGRLKDCALSTADHPSSIKCSRHRRSPPGRVRHRIVAFDYSCTVGILATCLLNDCVRSTFKHNALRTASLWYSYQLTRATDMVSTTPIAHF